MGKINFSIRYLINFITCTLKLIVVRGFPFEDITLKCCLPSRLPRYNSEEKGIKDVILYTIIRKSYFKVEYTNIGCIYLDKNHLYDEQNRAPTSRYHKEML